MVKMKQMAQGIGIPLQEPVPYILSQIVSLAGVPADAVGDISSIPPRPITSSSKIENPYLRARSRVERFSYLTLEDPRITISNSEWATRGWTYQEGVLSNRRLVFPKQQVYWECRGMAMNESLDLPLVDLYDPSGTQMADYMLSGIFDGDLHRA
jgi:hypothetical protein